MCAARAGRSDCGPVNRPWCLVVRRALAGHGGHGRRAGTHDVVGGRYVPYRVGAFGRGDVAVAAVLRSVSASGHVVDECLFCVSSSLVDVSSISQRYIAANVGVSRHSSSRTYTLRHADPAPSIRRPLSIALRSHGSVMPRNVSSACARNSLTCRNVVALRYRIAISTR